MFGSRTKTVGRLGGALVALALLAGPMGAQTCERFEYEEPRASGGQSLSVEVTELRFSTEGAEPELRVYFRATAENMGGEPIQAQLGLDLRLDGYERLRLCFELGTFSLGSATQGSFYIPLAFNGLSERLLPQGKYKATLVIGRVGPEGDSPRNNVDSREVDYESELVLSGLSRDGGALTIELDNQGLRPSGELQLSLADQSQTGISINSGDSGSFLFSSAGGGERLTVRSQNEVVLQTYCGSPGGGSGEEEEETGSPPPIVGAEEAPDLVVQDVLQIYEGDGVYSLRAYLSNQGGALDCVAPNCGDVAFRPTFGGVAGADVVVPLEPGAGFALGEISLDGLTGEGEIVVEVVAQVLGVPGERDTSNNTASTSFGHRLSPDGEDDGDEVGGGGPPVENVDVAVLAASLTPIPASDFSLPVEVDLAFDYLVTGVEGPDIRLVDVTVTMQGSPLSDASVLYLPTGPFPTGTDAAGGHEHALEFPARSSLFGTTQTLSFDFVVNYEVLNGTNWDARQFTGTRTASVDIGASPTPVFDVEVLYDGGPITRDTVLRHDELDRLTVNVRNIGGANLPRSKLEASVYIGRPSGSQTNRMYTVASGENLRTHLDAGGQPATWRMENMRSGGCMGSLFRGPDWPVRRGDTPEIVTGLKLQAHVFIRGNVDLPGENEYQLHDVKLQSVVPEDCRRDGSDGA